MTSVAGLLFIKEVRDLLDVRWLTALLGIVFLDMLAACSISTGLLCAGRR